MAVGERIVFTNDLDGVHYVAPPPLRTTLALLRGKLTIPPISDEDPKPFTRGSRFAEGVSWVSHRLRPYRKDALIGLEMFVDAAKTYGRELRVAILSGRQGVLHQLTNRRLESSGRMQVFHDSYLNESTSSSGWKEATVRKLLQEGSSVVHIDDDLRPTLRIARLDNEVGKPKVLVYLMGNLSNHPVLLRRGGIKLPQNVVRVASFREAGSDFTGRLRSGEF